MNLARIAQVCICIALFLAPISGGFVSTELQSSPPGGIGLRGWFGAAESPMLGFVLPTLLAVIGAILILGSRKVLQVPFPRMALPLAIFGATVVGSVALSSFRTASLAAAVQWMVCLAMPFAIVAVIGRGRCLKWALASISSGCTVVAVLGILEFAATHDPNWRVFCNWVNPNAAAGMLLLGLFPALSLALDEDRVWKMTGASASLLISIAILLTQSKGGYLAAAIGGIALLVMFFALGKSTKSRVVPALTLIIISVIALGLNQAMRTSAAKRAGQDAPVTMGRVSQAADTQDQSSGFRILLWKSAAELMKSNPFGSGPGTFRFESSRPGLVAQTHHAHQGFLQIGAESGWLALVAFLVGLGMLARESLRGAMRLPPERTVLLSGISAAIAASVAHNFIDSDIQHFGSGFTFFSLWGLALLAGHDGCTPEFLPRVSRTASIIGGISVAFAMIYFAKVDALKSSVRGSLAVRDTNSIGLVEQLRSLAPNDPESYALSMAIANSRDEAVLYAKRAAELGPTMRNHRQLARLQFASGEVQGAFRSVEKALVRDPNNLPALLLLMQFYEASDQTSMAIDTARRLIAVEASPVYKIRAIPESVPTQTFEARKLLADHESDSKVRLDLLWGAVRGYAEFAKRTVPQIAQGLAEDPNFQFAGDGLTEAERNVKLGKEMLSEIRAIQGDSAEIPGELDELTSIFDLAEDSLSAFLR